MLVPIHLYEAGTGSPSGILHTVRQEMGAGRIGYNLTRKKHGSPQKVLRPYHRRSTNSLLPRIVSLHHHHTIGMVSAALYAAAAVVFVSLYLLARKPKLSLPFPPGPPTLPIIGNVHQAPKSHPWLQYHAWSKTYGPVIHLNMAGQHVIVLTSSRAAHDLLAKRGATFSDRPHFVVSLPGQARVL